MIVLNTNVLSEVMRPAPDHRVMSWLSQQSTASLFISAVTQAEILYGLALLPEGQRRERLLAVAREMFAEEFAGRVLPFDREAAVAYAEIASARRRGGNPISQFDAQIAASAVSRGARLATRNERDFVGCGVEVLNPWSLCS